MVLYYSIRSETKKGYPVPAWERRFCLVAGRYHWKDFLEAKKYVSPYDRAMRWDDSAGKECFLNAKKLFRAKILGRPPQYEVSLPSPDMYIDQVDWNSKVDPQFMAELEAASCRVLENDGGDAEAEAVSMLPPKPTGWDVEIDDWQGGPRYLTRMIVGV